MWISLCDVVVGELLGGEGAYTLAKGGEMSQLLLLGAPAFSAVQETGCKGATV